MSYKNNIIRNRLYFCTRELGHELQLQREKRGLTYLEVAHAAGIRPPNVVNKVEKGQIYSILPVMKLASFYNVKVVISLQELTPDDEQMIINSGRARDED